MKSGELQRALETGRIPSLLFLYGEERFLLERAYQDVLAKVVDAAARDFNLEVFTGREATAEKVLDVCRTLPVFAPRRLVVVKDAHLLTANDLAGFLPYLNHPVPETVLLFIGRTIDGRLGFFREFKKKGTLVEFKPLYDNQIPGFVKEQARLEGKSFTEDGLALFCRRQGTDLGEIQAELLKLATYVGTRVLIDVEDVRQVVSDSRAESVFDLVNAIGQRRAAEALRLLTRMLEDGEPPLRILTMVVRHFRQLWQTAELQRLGAERGEMARRLRINPYFLDGLIAQARRFESLEFRRALAACLEVDLALKSSGGHPEAYMERLVLDLARGGEINKKGR
ncbi:DNA polymerase III subunit delta [Geoalkalibacter sp.]|uniref:DNA polymerase III subunit delta n=1 Tax=Geoalkalibacter sp. TaxID=3041440 RepID=UPI00272DE2DC|nr:DNA polymerase III subunit delta [Geoalkalibacter sp.]